MNRLRSIGTGLGAAMLALLVTGAGLAWACVPQPYIVLRPLASGAAGAEATVEGQNFTGDRHEIRWNGLDGEMLTTASGSYFSVGFKVPVVEPGMYTVLAVTREPGGTVGNVATASFQVTGATGQGSRSPESPDKQAKADPPAGSESSSFVTGMAGGAVASGLAGVAVVLARRRRS